MIQKIFERLNSLNNFSKNIIKCGCTFSLLLCMFGMGVIIYNEIELNKIATYNIGSTMIYTSIVVFAQIVIGSLLIDYFGNLLSNHE